jgi:hypothetical protein
LQEGGLRALFSLCNQPDMMTQYYVGCALANLACAMDNHKYMVEEGGIQPLIQLAYSPDPDVQQQAVAGLRSAAIVIIIIIIIIIISSSSSSSSGSGSCDIISVAVTVMLLPLSRSPSSILRC